MKLVNTEGIPLPILQAIIAADETYKEKTFLHLQNIKYDEQYSVTTLCRSPRQHQLYRRHYDEMEIDVSRRFYILNGNIIHYILERYPRPGAFSEVRMGCMFNYQGRKIYIHGACDEYQANVFLNDYKNTSTSILKKPTKEQWLFQLNVLRFIWQHNKISIPKLQNTYYFRDWVRAQARRNQDYPQMFCMVVNQPIWDDETVKTKLIERIKFHSSHVSTPDDDLPDCSSDDQWRDDVYRIIAKTKKGEWSLKSSGSAETEEEARQLASEKSILDYKLEHKLGEPTNCMHWCDAKNYCSQFNRESAQEVLSTTESN